MTCRDFERTWNELLDAETSLARAAGSTEVSGSSFAGREQALLQHAGECAPCAKVGMRYQVLRRAIRAMGPPPAPSAALADRIVAAVRSPPKNAWAVYRSDPPLPRFRILAGLAAAIVLMGVGLSLLDRPIEVPRGKIAFHNTPSDLTRGNAKATNASPGLNSALAEATAATWDLARSASEPAARISRDVLDAATKTEETPAEPAPTASERAVTASVSVPSLGSLVPDADAGAMLQQVGDHIAEGVRPLSATARHAFGFLLAPALAKPEVRLNLPAQKGA